MTRTCCPACRLRFTTATASGLADCPTCGEPLSSASSAELVGFSLWLEEPPPPTFADIAIAVERAFQTDRELS